MSNPIQAFRMAIMAVLGYAPELVTPGRLHRFGTNDRRGDSAGWCKLFEDLLGGVFGCYRRGISETWIAHERSTMTHAQRVEMGRQIAAATAERCARQRQLWSENARRNHQIWSQCKLLSPGDVGTRYLMHRGLDGYRPLPVCLRLHTALAYWHGPNLLGTFPALVAPLQAPDGRVVALHRTYLSSDGRKADVPQVKKLTGAAGQLAGASIPLGRPANGCVGIAEGIETALAAFRASTVPTVAAYCAGNLAAWVWPATVQRLIVFADADQAGRRAAQKLRARAMAAHLRCDVLTPTTEGADWCDVWASRDVMLMANGGAA